MVLLKPSEPNAKTSWLAEEGTGECYGEQGQKSSHSDSQEKVSPNVIILKYRIIWRTVVRHNT